MRVQIAQGKCFSPGQGALFASINGKENVIVAATKLNIV